MGVKTGGGLNWLGVPQCVGPALDFDANGRHVGENIQFFNSDSNYTHTLIFQASIGDTFGQGFQQAHMTRGDDIADAFGDRFVVHDPLQVILGGGGQREGAGMRAALVEHGKIDIEADALLGLVLEGMDSDAGEEGHVAQEDMTKGGGGAGRTEGFHRVRRPGG